MLYGRRHAAPPAPPGSAAPRLRREPHPVLDIVYVLGILALFAVVGFVARGAEKL
jgi:hypothetical protein